MNTILTPHGHSLPYNVHMCDMLNWRFSDELSRPQILSVGADYNDETVVSFAEKGKSLYWSLICSSSGVTGWRHRHE